MVVSKKMITNAYLPLFDISHLLRKIFSVGREMEEKNYAELYFRL